jgi:UDP-GlcNAc:undecaprenyl-phosphate/decaprenyl-phosphate GlcNAc-1-phosphate transferase
MTFLFTLFLSVLLTVALVPLLRRCAYRCNVLDLPDDRKVHVTPIPRVGGAAMAVGVLVSVVLWNFSSTFMRAFLAATVVLVVFGLADDYRSLSPKAKFAGQLIAAGIVVWFGDLQIMNLGALLPDGVRLSPWLAIPLTIVAIVGVTNAINLADGLDGLAGGICLLSFSCIGYLAYLDGAASIGLAALAFIGAIFGFLRFNTHPASIFMGDTGSQLLGFAAITLSLSLTQRDTALSPLLPLILLGFPVLDTLTVMITRIVKGRSPFSADKNHFHHNLLALGFRHPESVLVIYLMQTLLVLSAIVFRFYTEWLLLGGYLLFSFIILTLFAMARRHGWQIRRFDLLDVVIVGELRRLRDEGIIIRVLFRSFRLLVPALLLMTCAMTGEFPVYLRFAAPLCAVVLLLFWFLRDDRLGLVLRPILYLHIPFAVYLSETNPAPWVSASWKLAQNSLFGLCTLCIVLVSRFTRRKEGFKSNPFDFLILFLVAVCPNLPVLQLQEYHLGMIAAKVIILYFSYEVLLSELRCNFAGPARMTLLALVLVTLG